MTRNYRGLWLTAAAGIAFAMMGCGEMTGSDAGTGGIGSACTSDTSCASGNACHPVLKTCAKTCTGGTDCPSNEKTCQKINNSTASFCTCSTDALCAATTAGQICNLAVFKCTDKCTVSSCPVPLTCELDAGQCRSSGGTDGGTDAGTDAGVGDAGVPCNSSNFEPDVCTYANVCYSNNQCDTASDDRCPNITAAINAGNYTAWSPATSTGPVIWNVIDDPDVAAGCTAVGEVAFTTTVHAYAGTTLFPSNITAAVQLTYYTSTGAVRPINGVQVGNTSNAWSHYTVTNSGKNAEMKMTLCAPAGTTGLTVGFAYSGGNAYCQDLTRN
ncbi:MAG: hypothetical protein Q8L48_44320 [Archangium sp.]|nr:hypothetical protein [Archangium sp.]